MQETHQLQLGARGKLLALACKFFNFVLALSQHLSALHARCQRLYRDFLFVLSLWATSGRFSFLPKAHPVCQIHRYRKLNCFTQVSPYSLAEAEVSNFVKGFAFICKFMGCKNIYRSLEIKCLENIKRNFIFKLNIHKIFLWNINLNYILLNLS